MKSASTLLFVAGAAAAAVKRDNTTSYLARMADTHMRLGVAKDYGYTNAVIYGGMELAYALTKNETIATWYEGQMSIVEDDGTITDYDETFYSLDEYRFGMNALWWYDRTGEEKYLTAATTIRGMLDRHPRTPSGGFWHRSPTYPDQMWLDGIFMADTFYAKWTSLYDNDNTTAWDDIVNQYTLIETHCRNATSGLLQHGYDESFARDWADPVTGASPFVWDRAVGWYFVSLLETIQLIPTTHSGYAKLVEYYTTLATGLLAAQDASSGGWWLIMNEPYPGMEGNYIESSATAMFTYGFLKGIKLGLISATDYFAPAEKAYKMMLDKFLVENANGTLTWEGTVLVGSLKGEVTYAYYTGVALSPNDYKGVGPFMMASYEYETYSS